MNVVRRALTAAAIGGTVLAGVATVGATAAEAAVKVPTHLAIKAPHATTYGTTVTVWGKLTYAHRRGTLPSGQPVTLMERATPRGTWQPDGTGTTDANGVVAITSTNTLTRTEQFRLSYAGDTSIKPVTRASHSAVKTVKVRYGVTTPANGTATPDVVSATVSPVNKGAKVMLERKKGRRGWAVVGRAREDAAGQVSFTIKKAGTYRIVKPSAHRVLTGMSGTFTVS